MAVLNAQTIAQKLVYQRDAKNNLQEAPGAATAIPADGSMISGSVGNSPNVTRIPKPGQGFPTGKSTAHPTGTYGKLVTAVTQQSTDSVAGQGTATPVGMHVSADSHSHAGTNDLQADLKNDVSSMSLAAGSSQTSTPTIATGVGPAAGLSQSPELQ